MKCDASECFCCGNGHFCEPPYYPTSIDEAWVCTCGRQHRAFDPRAEGHIPDRFLAVVPNGTLGWRS